MSFPFLGMTTAPDVGSVAGPISWSAMKFQGRANRPADLTLARLRFIRRRLRFGVSQQVEDVAETVDPLRLATRDQHPHAHRAQLLARHPLVDAVGESLH